MSALFQLPLVVSYYTKDTPYEKEVENLIASCKKFNIEHCIEGIKDRGSWAENCAYKPYFLKKKMKELNRPLLWVDADGVFLQGLIFEDFMYSDLVFYYDPKIKDPRFTAAAGTVYINFTEGGKESLDLWCYFSDEIIKEAGKPLRYMDQASLHFSMISKRSFNFIQLPIQYAKIFDRDIPGLDPSTIVIEHNQASRRFVRKEGVDVC
jgi:hypothetical protein